MAISVLPTQLLQTPPKSAAPKKKRPRCEHPCFTRPSVPTSRAAYNLDEPDPEIDARLLEAHQVCNFNIWQALRDRRQVDDFWGFPVLPPPQTTHPYIYPTKSAAFAASLPPNPRKRKAVDYLEPRPAPPPPQPYHGRTVSFLSGSVPVGGVCLKPIKEPEPTGRFRVKKGLKIDGRKYFRVEELTVGEVKDGVWWDLREKDVEQRGGLILRAVPKGMRNKVKIEGVKRGNIWQRGWVNIHNCRLNKSGGRGFGM